MLIRELTRMQSMAFVARSRLGRLAFTEGEQPYITPINYACKENHIYCFTTFGQKIRAMRSNPLVAFEVEEFSPDREWISAVITGRYEELAQYGADGETAWELLQQYTMLWEPGYAITIRNDGTQRSLEPIYFRIHIESISGHQACKSGIA